MDQFKTSKFQFESFDLGDDILGLCFLKTDSSKKKKKNSESSIKAAQPNTRKNSIMVFVGH